MIVLRQPYQITDYDRSKATGEMEYLNCVGSLIANGVIKYRIAMAKATFKKKTK